MYLDIKLANGEEKRMMEQKSRIEASDENGLLLNF